jgi:DNA-binding beta-propeller fold protein YncE
MPTAGTPAVNSFSPDGKISYINGGGTATTVVDAVTYKVLANVTVGASASQSAAHPNGKVVYTLVSQEMAVAVIDTSTWQVTGRIQLPGNGNGMYILKVTR